MVQTLIIPHNYNPRFYQLPFLDAMDSGFKRAVLVWHRRSGKDKTVLNWSIKKMLKRVGVYYYFLPTYSQGKKIIWKGIDGDGFKFIDHFPDEIIAKKNESDMSIELINGSIFQIIGTDKYDSIVGTNPVGCIYSEYSLQDPRAWDLFRPILRENGGWAVFIYTPRGDNHGKDLAEMAEANPHWFYQKLSVNDTRRPDGTPVISAADIQAERDEGMSEELVQQEYYCSFEGSVDGAYFGKQIAKAAEDGRITRVPYDAALKVDTYWDLGIDDSMTIWFTQTVGKEIRVIDYYENSGEGFPHYAKYLASLDYVYGEHNMPHDVEVRELSAGETRKVAAEKLGIKPVVVIPRVSKKESAIEAGRSILSRCYFDKEKCKDGISALKNYQKEWDEKKKVFKKRPLHNWASHGADSFMALAMGYKDKIKAMAHPGSGGRGTTGSWMR